MLAEYLTLCCFSKIQQLLVQEEKGLSGQTGRDLHTTSEATLPGPEPAAEAGNESRRADVSPTSSNKSSEGSGSKQVSEELPRSNGAPTQRDSGSKNSVEEQLAANSAGSTASRHGGSMYDIIVQVSLYSLHFGLLHPALRQKS